MRSAFASLLALFFVACASAPANDGAQSTAAPPAERAPTIGVVFRQINSSKEVFRNPGRVSLEYIVTITNPTAEPFTVERIELKSVTPGAYAVRENAQTRVGRTIPPNMGLNVPVHAWGIAPGGHMQMEEPVTIAVYVYGSGPDNKTIVRRVQRSITEFHEE